ncbi:hypothetical protein J4204_06760 [Candidatus Woesearchaeota archaeon]|nr:hypothetical protein [Candidatus Woesearchaeota archaeon]
MAKIHWLIYVIVGLFISIASYKLDYEKLVFFFYVGFIFVFIGILKLIFNLVKNRTTKKETAHHKAVHQQSNTKYCNQCGAALSLHHKFCKNGSPAQESTPCSPNVKRIKDSRELENRRFSSNLRRGGAQDKQPPQRIVRGAVTKCRRRRRIERY